MSNILYGSSNIYRHFERVRDAGKFAGRDLQLVRCTKKAVLDASLASLTSASLVITSVLENFISEVCIGVADDEVQLFAHQQITAHVESLFGLVTRLSDVNVLISPPIYRSEPSWFGSYLPDFLGFLTAEVARVGSARLAVCAPFIVYPSLLEADGVHLTNAGGDRLMSHLEAALDIMLVDASNVTEMDGVEENTPTTSSSQLTQILNVVSRNSSQLDSISSLGEAVTELHQSTSSFEAFVRRRFKNDDFVFARLKEESNVDVNRSREDRVVISGLAGSFAATHAEKKKHFVEVVTRLVEISCASIDPLPRVMDVYVNLRKDRGQPLVEARIDTASGAQAFRREGVRLAKAEHAEFASLFFSNSVTQSTRVRIEVLKAFAKKLTSTTENAYVQGFISRPVLQYHVKEGCRSKAEGVGRSYNYVDAVSKFGSKLTQKDLISAYARAGNVFAGSMSQYFVLLSDAHLSIAGSSANRIPLGRRGAPAGRGAYGRYRGATGRTLPSSPLVVTEAGASIRVPTPSISADSDRGLKRPCDSPGAEPSKKQENASNTWE